MTENEIKITIDKLSELSPKELHKVLVSLIYRDSRRLYLRLSNAINLELDECIEETLTWLRESLEEKCKSIAIRSEYRS